MNDLRPEYASFVFEFKLNYWFLLFQEKLNYLKKKNGRKNWFHEKEKNLI